MQPGWIPIAYRPRGRANHPWLTRFGHRGKLRTVRAQGLVRRHQLRPPVAPDIAWAAFAGLNLAAMRLFPAWQTVPFLAIWVSLTVIYGFRLWRLQPTILTLVAVTLATGGIIGVQVIKGQQDADYLAEVPLIALMFLVMVLHGRRRLAATQEG